MRRWKKVLYAGITIGIILIGVRIGIVNHNLKLPKVQVYEKGQTVEYGDDYTKDSSDRIKGYSITIKDSELIPIEEYYSKYLHMKFEPDMDPDTKYYYVVKAVFHNKDNDQGSEVGVSLDRELLVGSNYSIVVDYSTFQLANPKLQGVGFSLRKNSSFEVVMPFGVVPETQADYKTLVKNPPKFQITDYPHRKLLKIQ